MASLYKKPRSPFWYMNYIDLKEGRVNVSTKLRWDDPEQTRKARALAAERTAAELAAPRSGPGEGWTWVGRWQQSRYRSNAHTLKRMENAWFSVSTYLRAQAILVPRALTREHCIDYLQWRTSPAAAKAGLRKAAHNTVLLELKALSAVMREAVQRGMAGANPCLQLGLKKVRGKVKPRITDDEADLIERALASDESKHIRALRMSWLIAIRLGCRLSETCLPLEDVDLGQGTVTFRIKGGREHTQTLHPDLVPVFRQLKRQGKSHAFEMPPSFSAAWTKFFRRHGLGHLSFHCTRVTVVSALRDAGVDERVAMDFVGHNSVLIHRIYQRGRRAEQDAAVAALQRPMPSFETGSERSDSAPST